MRLVRYLESGQPVWGVIEGNDVATLGGTGFPQLRTKATTEFLPPCLPRQIVCVALNYRSVADALEIPIPENPVFFLKALGSLGQTGDDIHLPDASQDVVQEAELAIVLKRDVFRAGRETAAAAIGGYTIANDVTARDIQTRGGSYLWTTVSKSFPTFFPCGPHIETELSDFADRRLECRINGVTHQSALLGDMIFPPAELIARLSQVMPLYAGDIVATGTPLGYQPIHDGDLVEISIEGLGTLSNPVRRDGPAT
jgi:2-keto-4-pentenoate hydratase/2-oxohepta-3-ene-1,7-dioic acid hydratase in catechol pathway